MAAASSMKGPFSVLITGANQGLGFVTAQQILTSHADVTLYACARSQDKATGAAEKLTATQGRKESSKVVPLVVDVTDDATIEAAAKQVPALDILVNNAGIYLPDDLSSPSAVREQMRSVYDTNVFGVAAMVTAFLPSLHQAKQNNPQRRPAIVNVSSELGSIQSKLDPNWKYSFVKSLVYPSSKAAVNFITAFGRIEYPDFRVVSVTPGYCATNLNAYSGHKTADAGGEIITRAALDHDGPTGRFFGEEGEELW